MGSPAIATRSYLILREPNFAHLGQRDFGMPGLHATESIGPFVEIQACGPLITVHDATGSAHLGIGHHPHRWNERLFYIMDGQLDHDDALNGITGHMDTGDLGQFTEGRRGMLHQEWNHGDRDCHAFILVYITDPVPEKTAFGRLKDAEAPRYEEAAGIQTKELVGRKSPLKVNGDIRFFADSSVDLDASLRIEFGTGEGGLVFVQEGTMILDRSEEGVGRGEILLIPPAQEEGTISLQAGGAARLIRVVFGPGQGLIRGKPYARR